MCVCACVCGGPPPHPRGHLNSSSRLRPSLRSARRPSAARRPRSGTMPGAGSSCSPGRLPRGHARAPRPQRTPRTPGRSGLLARLRRGRTTHACRSTSRAPSSCSGRGGLRAWPAPRRAW
eukprot:scaffold15896_cov65-Phaeocystis_antarctica.AAC.3